MDWCEVPICAVHRAEGTSYRARTVSRAVPHATGGFVWTPSTVQGSGAGSVVEQASTPSARATRSEECRVPPSVTGPRSRSLSMLEAPVKVLHRITGRAQPPTCSGAPEDDAVNHLDRGPEIPRPRIGDVHAIDQPGKRRRLQQAHQLVRVRIGRDRPRLHRPDDGRAQPLAREP